MLLHNPIRGYMPAIPPSARAPHVSYDGEPPSVSPDQAGLFFENETEHVDYRMPVRRTTFWLCGNPVDYQQFFVGSLCGLMSINVIQCACKIRYGVDKTPVIDGAINATLTLSVIGFIAEQIFHCADE